jgi:hypothetical protein
MGAKSRRPPQGKALAERPASDSGVPPKPTAEESLEDRLDEALDESFPASDPPAVHPMSNGRAYLP